MPSWTAQTLTVKAAGQGNQATLPVDVALAKELPAKLTVDSKLPALRGSPKSNFEYTLTIKNDSGRNLTASFAANAPPNFETSFTEAYGTQELSSIPIDAGQSKDIKLKVRPPSTIDAGHFPVQVTVKAEDASAKTEVALDVVGQPQLQVAGRDGLLSARAVAGTAELDPDRRHQHRHARRPTTSSLPRPRRPAGRSHSSRRPSIGWCRARTPRCRRWSRRATSRWPATT